MKVRLMGTETVVEVESTGSLPRGARAARDGKTLWVSHGGETYRFQEVTRARVHEEEHDLVAPMPGKVTRVLVEAGETVTRGRPLLVLEAMKMEHEIRAPRDGKVTRVHRAAGEMVGLSDPLVELE